MFAVKLFVCSILLMGVSGRSLVHERAEYEPQYYVLPQAYLEDDSPVLIDEKLLLPVHTGRVRRQAQGSLVLNSDGTSGANLKVPFAGNDKNMLSAIGGMNFTPNQKIASGTAGLAYDHVNGHGLTLTKTHIPSFGDRVAAAGTVNLFHNNNHNLDANAFAARTTLNNHAVPSFNTVGGGVDYMFKNKVGAGFSVARTPMFQQTDMSATGKLNLFRNRDSSLDFNAGFSKSSSPFMPSQSWQPSTGFSFRKFF